METSYFVEITRSLADLEEVEAILLAGSKAVQTDDSLSDYDVYVYVTSELPLVKREAITKKYCRYMELNNQFWETEDDGELKDGTEIELIYRDLNWLDTKLVSIVFNHNASIGYSTCFWSNLLNSKIIFDRKGKAKKLQDKFQVDYPQELKNNIIYKNYQLLNNSKPAYRNQIEKALKRNDFISVNHRVTELLASYFDILFAINEFPHPGEKRLIEISKAMCTKLPSQFEYHMKDIIRNIGSENSDILNVIDQMIKNLTILLIEENLLND